jgi:hypothetical protein
MNLWIFYILDPLDEPTQFRKSLSRKPLVSPKRDLVSKNSRMKPAGSKYVDSISTDANNLHDDEDDDDDDDGNDLKDFIDDDDGGGYAEELETRGQVQSYYDKKMQKAKKSISKSGIHS